MATASRRCHRWRRFCVDDHLGYAEPVSGVIADERQISLCGVGLDIGCANVAARLAARFAVQGPAAVVSRNDERIELETATCGPSGREWAVEASPHVQQLSA